MDAFAEKMGKETVYQPELLLPEIVLPENITHKRRLSLLSFIHHPPQVDTIHVLGRSGSLAAIGLFDNPNLCAQYELPPMVAVDGIGNELWTEWKQLMRAELRDDEIPDEGLGIDSNDAARRPFVDWILSGASPNVQRAVDQLRHASPHPKMISLLDDIQQSGNVAYGIAPAIYQAAYGKDFQYDPKNNRYVFQSADWIGQIVKASFGENLNRRQWKFLVELAKGTTDWPGFTQFDPSNIHSLDQIAKYMAKEYLGYEAQTIPPETVYDLIKKFGTNLFGLHEGVKAALRSHAQEVLK